MALIENKAIGLIISTTVELIVAVTTIEEVGAIAGEESVIAFAAFNGVGSIKANDDVVLFSAKEWRYWIAGELRCC